MKLIVELRRVAPNGQSLKVCPSIRAATRPLGCARRNVHLLAESLAGSCVCQKIKLITDHWLSC
ncbi:MAG: hypothetical protein Ct9H300mP32_6220 [Verrucomicrobiota bacterium]|nr:MAG: hypothetical protein Ct9H300mP32_6220 [Verrucomicrobiota bacterium]